MLNDLRALVSSNNLDDIILSGITSVEDGIAEFIPNMKYIYFEFDDVLIEFESIEQHSRVGIKRVKTVIHESDFEDVIPSSTSIARIIFTNSIDRNRVQMINLINGKEFKSRVECDAVEIILENGQTLFIDPMFFGMNIGGKEQKRFWKENRLDDKPYQVIKINA